jgi:hypothetical protein
MVKNWRELLPAEVDDIQRLIREQNVSTLQHLGNLLRDRLEHFMQEINHNFCCSFDVQQVGRASVRTFVREGHVVLRGHVPREKPNSRRIEAYRLVKQAVKRTGSSFGRKMIIGFLRSHGHNMGKVSA